MFKTPRALNLSPALSNEGKSQMKSSTPRKQTPFTLPIPGFGERPMTSVDFEAACGREGITLRRERLRRGVYGMFAFHEGVPTIYIDSRLKGGKRVHTEFHELAHYFLHRTRAGLLGRVAETPLSPAQAWAEVEAEAAAIAAVAPGFPFAAFFQYCAENVVRGGKLWRLK